MNSAILICPLCGGTLIGQVNSLRCPQNHSFDVARQGYVNLLPVQRKHSKHPGDSKEMVAARTRFLNSTAYEPIAGKLVSTVVGHLAGRDKVAVLDAGCGEGYYTDCVQRGLVASRPATSVNIIGLDISKEAVAAAAKRNRDITWIVGTNAHVPVAPASLDLILCVFGFPSYEGFKPLLKPSGKIVLVDPGPDHLLELREVIYPTVKRSPPPDVSRAEAMGFRVLATETLAFRTARLNRDELRDLLAMTPYLYRATPEGRAAAEQLESLAVGVEVVIRTLGLE